MANMPEVNAVFGAAPEIAFPSDEAPKGLKAVEIVEGDGPMVRRGDTVTVNYTTVWSGARTRPLDSSFARHQPGKLRHRRRPGDSRRLDQTVPGLNSRLPSGRVDSAGVWLWQPGHAGWPASAAATRSYSSSTSSSTR